MVSHVRLCVYGYELQTVILNRFLDGDGDSECSYSIIARYSEWSGARTGVRCQMFWAFIRNIVVCDVDTTP